MSKLITLNADEKTATVADAEIGDIFTTILSDTKAVTGAYGLIQKAGLVMGGMTINSFRLRRSFNPFVSGV